MVEYKQQLEKGLIQQAYRGLMDYFSALRAYFQKNFPDYEISGYIYSGYMDMTYFAVIPASLKQRKLKVAIVFLHEAFRFEVWLSGYNRQVQVKYWQLIRESGWNKYRLVANPLKADAVIEQTIMEFPDFSDQVALTRQIEHETMAFIKNIEEFFRDYDKRD